MKFLLHVCDDPNITCFEPRPVTNARLGLEDKVVFAITGYTISRQRVTPLAMRTIDNMLLELAGHDVEIRIQPSLWPLYDAVVNSSLQFSMIRMRNAVPRG